MKIGNIVSYGRNPKLYVVSLKDFLGPSHVKYDPKARYRHLIPLDGGRTVIADVRQLDVVSDSIEAYYGYING